MGDYEIPSKIQRLYEDIHPEQLRYHQRRVAVRKEFTFDAAHHLHLYDGKCQSLHGHTYRLAVTISGVPDERGLCMDFAELKAIYESAIARRLDHRYLNEVLPPMNTTAENMIVWMWEQLDAHLQAGEWKKRGIRLEELCLHETPTSSAILKREWMESHGQ
ncbi:6-carboxytetrahydropterin synthase QueD [Alicyclobacillus kakegawensis]|uniref:6-carboxytetrahydropterin synthase QueD n=1 Tax=Alicyclobacillus kakegawensis TaxID=392012 RepID=UPI00082F03E7|nr:6-carboxytetrahydropterin synthase QueD [Alicyclobacillus kakegawensis]